MTGLMAVCGAAVAAGLLLAALGMLPRITLSTRSSTPVHSRVATGVRSKATRAQLLRIVASVTLGLLGLAVTGWPIMLAIGPLAVLGLPALLATPPARELELLTALDRWVRTLTASLPTGRSIADAIRLSARQVPDDLAPHVELLILRLDERWSTWDALRAMADDLDNPHADAVVASLMLAARRGGTGATATLRGISDSLQERLRAMRDIEAERAKPRVVVRQVTIITVAVLTLALLAGRDFFAPYSSPLGQAVLAALIAAYAGSLVLMRRVTRARRRERILVGMAR